MYGNKNNYIYSLFLVSHKKQKKSPRGFRKWTFLKMSKIEKLKKVLKKGALKRGF
jgi:hypothetical protein